MKKSIFIIATILTSVLFIFKFWDIFKKLIFLFIFIISNCYNGIELPKGEWTEDSSIEDRFLENDNYAKRKFQVDDPYNFEFYVIADPHYGYFSKYKIPHFNVLSADYVQNKIPNKSKIFINGDIFCDGGLQDHRAYDTDIKRVDYETFPVIGNHDKTHNLYKYYEKFGKTIYDYVIGDTHIIVLDSADQFLGTSQINWLKNKLENTTCKNIIILSHVPFWFSEYFKEHGTEELCYNNNVNLAVFGHMHYAKTKILNNTTFETISSISINDEHLVLKVKIINNQLSWESL